MHYYPALVVGYGESAMRATFPVLPGCFASASIWSFLSSAGDRADHSPYGGIFQKDGDFRTLSSSERP